MTEKMHLLDFIGQQFQNHVALIHQSHSWTFGEIYKKSDEWRSLLVGQVNEGEIVVCEYEADPFQYLTKFIGVLSAGGVHLSTRDFKRTEGRLQNLGMPWSAITKKINPIGIGFMHVATYEEYEYSIALPCQNLKPQLNTHTLNSNSSEVKSKIKGGRILETSGTTGEPKWVYWSEEGLIGDRLEWVDALSIGKEDVILNMHPLDFAHGMDVHLLTGLLSGAKVIHKNIQQDLIQSIISDIREYKVTMMSALPSHYAKIANACDDLNSCKTVRWGLTGGALLSANTVNRVKEKTGMDLTRLYGATEAGIMCIDFNANQISPKLQAMDGVEVQLRPIDEVSNTYPNVYEPYFKRKYMANFYWGDQAKTQQSFKDGWYKSGDAIMKNQDGTYSVLGRSSDVWVNDEGKLVCSGEIANSLLQIDDLSEVVVISPKLSKKATSTFFCMVKEGNNITNIKSLIEDKICAFLKEYKVYLVSDWPKTAVGKPELRLLLNWCQ